MNTAALLQYWVLQNGILVKSFGWKKKQHYCYSKRSECVSVHLAAYTGLAHRQRPEHLIFNRKCSKSRANKENCAWQQRESPEEADPVENSRSSVEFPDFLRTVSAPVIFIGRCANRNRIFAEGLHLQDANGLFFCVLKICRTPRCLLEADKPVETRRGLYSPIIPCFLEACIKLL